MSAAVIHMEKFSEISNSFNVTVGCESVGPDWVRVLLNGEAQGTDLLWGVVRAQDHNLVVLI